MEANSQFTKYSNWIALRTQHNLAARLVRTARRESATGELVCLISLQQKVFQRAVVQHGYIWNEFAHFVILFGFVEDERVSYEVK